MIRMILYTFPQLLCLFAGPVIRGEGVGGGTMSPAFLFTKK